VLSAVGSSTKSVFRAFFIFQKRKSEEIVARIQESELEVNDVVSRLDSSTVQTGDDIVHFEFTFLNAGNNLLTLALLEYKDLLYRR
jgi:hypothetical protein